MVGRELVSLVVAFISVLHELAEPTLLKVSIVLCLDGFHLALNCGINFILEGSLIGCHLSLPASWEVAGVRL